MSGRERFEANLRAGLVVASEPYFPTRRFRFRLVSMATIVTRSNYIDGNRIDVLADPQRRESVRYSENGVEWRPGYDARNREGAVVGRFFPYESVVEVETRNALVLEYRDLYEDERPEDAEALDRTSDDWGPVDPTNEAAFRALWDRLRYAYEEPAR